jgi:hypothetical protein
MKIKKKIEPDKFLPQHESDPDLRSAPGDSYARFFFSLNRQRCCLTFNEDECLRLAYLFEQAAHRLADRVVEQSDEGYTVKYQIFRQPNLEHRTATDGDDLRRR